jgi:hypothetical protein
VGLLIGILGGPLGVLIGGATGLLVGSLFDLEDADDTESVLTGISKDVRAGQNTLLADLGEPSDHEVVDAVMSSRTGTVLRRTVADVEAEIAAADEAQHEAKKEARKQLLKAREAKQKEEVDEKVAQLKAKLPHHRGASAAPPSATGVAGSAS